MPADLRAVTVVVTNYNGRAVLPRTLATLRTVLGPTVPVIVADSGSTDGSPEDAAKHFPEVRVVQRDRFSPHVNITRNMGVRAATTPLVFLIDNDIDVAPGCIEELMRVMRSSDSVFCCTPRLLDFDDANKIYADGNHLHFLGLSGATKRNRLVSDTPLRPPSPTFAGGIMLIDVRRAEELGLWDEGFPFGWADDCEIQLRGRLRGFQALHVPTAICVHQSKDHGTKRSYGQFYNRYRLIWIVYSRRSLFLLAPPLLVFELALTLLSLGLGISGERWRAVKDVWRTRADIRARRAAAQASRRVRDSTLMAAGVVELGGPMGRSDALRTMTRVMTTALDAYWRLVRRWL